MTMQNIGGQAVIEGVLMKSPTKECTAVRRPDGSIVTKTEKSISITKRHKILNIPFIRGIIILFETLIMGIKALNYSTEVSLGEDGNEEKISTLSLALTLILSIGFALILFKLIPLGIAEVSAAYSSYFENRVLFNLTEGLSKILILIGYIYAISLMPDVRRVFEYHGAEHKVVNAFEKNDLKNVKKYSTIHVRCGTSFILFVLALSILVYLFLPTEISFLSKYSLRLLLLPIIAGIAYELIKISPKYEKKFWFKAIISPGLLMQKLTTREPDEKQLEVAKAALKGVT